MPDYHLSFETPLGLFSMKLTEKQFQKLWDAVDDVWVEYAKRRTVRTGGSKIVIERKGDRRA